MVMNMNRILLALGLVAGLSAPALAETISPVGTWTTTTGESRYDITLCGDGTQLCAELVWLRKDARSDESEAYLGTYLVEEAELVAENTWRGDVHIFDTTLGGTITMVNRRTINLEGCYLVFCRSFTLKRN